MQLDCRSGDIGARSLGLRRRTGSAGDAVLSKVERNARIVRRLMKGALQKDVADEFGMSPASICTIAGHFLSRDLRVELRDWGFRERLMRRSDEVFALYECGFTVREIASRIERTYPVVERLLAAHPDYVPRVVPHGGWRRVGVPEWVPTEHRGRYQRIACCNGFDVASTCIRAMLAWEARR